MTGRLPGPGGAVGQHASSSVARLSALVRVVARRSAVVAEDADDLRPVGGAGARGLERGDELVGLVLGVRWSPSRR